MKYDLDIRKHNVQAHLDIEEDIKKQKNGLYTFILRVNNGNIVDYNVIEYVDAKRYLGVSQVIIKQSAVAYYYRERGQTDPLRPDNIKR